MIRTWAGLVLCMLLASYANAEPPPLTEDQRASITKLANETKKEADRLKGLLDRRQLVAHAVHHCVQVDLHGAPPGVEVRLTDRSIETS